MDLQTLIKEYLHEAKLMQLATVKDNKPWVCTVWYVHDKNFNLYFDSQKTRRHSQELLENPKVAGAIVTPHTEGRGQKVRGIQLEGAVRPTTDQELPKAYQSYFRKYPRSPKPIEEFLTPDASTTFYVVRPSLIVLFDEVNFPDNPRQEYKVP